jgi:RimJ/RimL family protein N-acetyltransferase
MCKVFLETAHLLVYQPTHADVFEWEVLFNDTEVMQYAQHGWDEPAVELALSIANWQQYGYGIGLVILKETQQVIGISGLYLIEKTNEIATVTLLKPQHWHHHYSFELKQAHIGWAFTHLNVEYILAVIFPENIASQKVLEKAGMHFYKRDYYYDNNDQLDYYIITREIAKKINSRAKT